MIKMSCFIILLTMIFLSSSAFAEKELFRLHEGWTLVGLAVTPRISYTAESLGRQINAQGGSCNRVMRWDGGSWQTHLIGTPSGDFPINTTEGYFILCAAPGILSVEGESVNILSQYLHKGWSIVNAPFERLTAESMGQDINLQAGSCDRIMRWDGSAWNTHLIGMPFGDFPIRKNESYFVLSSSDSAWNFAISTPSKPVINAVASPTSNPIQTLSGAKDINTSIWINGLEKVPIDGFTTWSVSILLTEGQNQIRVSAKNSIGAEAGPVVADILLDTTPPTTPVVTDDGAATNYIGKLHAVWQSQDPETGISEYQYAIGTSAGGIDVVDWASCGMQTEFTKTGLSLVKGSAYYLSVKAKNNVGLWSGIGTSDGITLVQSAPSIGSIAPQDGSLSEVGGTIPFNINAGDPEGDAIQYKISVDGQVVSDWNSAPSFDWQTASQSSGIKQVIIYVKDTWGNESSGNVSIYLARKALDTP